MKGQWLENLVFAAAGAGVFIGTEKHFVEHMIPLPSWPYGLSLAGVTFCLLKTVSVWIRTRFRKEDDR